MDQLLIFYLMTTGPYVVPMIIVSMCLQHGTALPFLPKSWRNRPSVKRGLRYIGAARLEQLLEYLDSDIKNYLADFAKTTSIVQVSIVQLISLCIIFEVPLPFFPNIKEFLSMDAMVDLMIFTATTCVIQLLPMIFLVFALVNRIPLPFLRYPPVKPIPSTNEIACWEEHSEKIGSLVLTRFENSEKTIFFANCVDDDSDVIFKAAFCQEKKVDAKTECYLYDEDVEAVEKVMPAPISVKHLEGIFNDDDDDE